MSADTIAAEKLSEAELAALLCSRVCHDIISPVGAITNGLELLEEDLADDMKDVAHDLIRRSATQASNKLKFARIAFGAAGSAGSSIDTGDAEDVAKGYMESEKAELEWNIPRLLLAKDKVKLILNLILVSVNCVPRGGTVRVDMEGSSEEPGFTLVCEGRSSRIPSDIEMLIAGGKADTVIDAHSIQPFYAGMLSRMAGLTVTFSQTDDVVTIRAS